METNSNLLYERQHKLEVELEDFEVVLTELNKLDKAKKCFRKIGGILVETNVKDAILYLEKGIFDIHALLRELKEKKTSLE